MPQDVINEHTDKNLKNYLSAEKNPVKAAGNGELMADLDEAQGKKSKGKKIIFVVLFVVLLGVSALGYFTFMKGQDSFDKAKVKVEIDASSDISSGQDMVVNIKYENDTDVRLKDPKISLFIPKEFIFVSSDREAQKDTALLSWKLNDLAVGEKGSIKLFGRLIGKKDSEYDLASKISYMPDNFNYAFESSGDSSKAHLKIVSVPFDLSVKAPEYSISGDEVAYSIKYKNSSSGNFKQVKIKVELPQASTYVSAEPEPNEKGEASFAWNADNLASGAEGNILLKAVIKGAKDEKKEIKVSLEASENGDDLIEFVSEAAPTVIQEAPIILTQTVNGAVDYSANKGEELEYKIKFKNISDKEIKGLVINDELDGNADLSSLAINDGSYDSKYKITWSAFNVPKLASIAPQEEGEVSFKVKVKSFIEVKGQNDKNFVINNKASISNFNFSSDSVDLVKTIATNEIAVKINASIFMSMKGYFNDDGRITNSGVIPPEVGKETTYTIHWSLSSVLNDVKNVRISTILPPDVKWKGNFVKPNGEKSLGDENNGTSGGETADPQGITAINGGLGANKQEVVYNWYDKTIYNNDNDKGLPQNLKLGDTLKFIYDDGNVKQMDACVIQENPSYQGHYFYCSVPWKAELPAYAEKKNYRIEKAFAGGAENFFYNPQTRELAWELTKLDANTGTVSPAKEVVFQVSITPTDADIGKPVKIMDKVETVGYDDFTNKKIDVFEDVLTTELPDDESIGMEEGIVIPASVGLQDADGMQDSESVTQ